MRNVLREPIFYSLSSNQSILHILNLRLKQKIILIGGFIESCNLTFSVYPLYNMLSSHFICKLLKHYIELEWQSCAALCFSFPHLPDQVLKKFLSKFNSPKFFKLTQCKCSTLVAIKQVKNFFYFFDIYVYFEVIKNLSKFIDSQRA